MSLAFASFILSNHSSDLRSVCIYSEWSANEVDMEHQYPQFDGEALLLDCCISLLLREEFLTEVGHWPVTAIRIWLTQNSPHASVRGIRLENKGLVPLGTLQHGRSTEGALQLVKGSGTLRSPGHSVRLSFPC